MIFSFSEQPLADISAGISAYGKSWATNRRGHLRPGISHGRHSDVTTPKSITLLHHPHVWPLPVLYFTSTHAQYDWVSTFFPVKLPTPPTSFSFNLFFSSRLIRCSLVRRLKCRTLMLAVLVTRKPSWFVLIDASFERSLTRKAFKMDIQSVGRLWNMLKKYSKIFCNFWVRSPVATR